MYALILDLATLFYSNHEVYATTFLIIDHGGRLNLKITYLDMIDHLLICLTIMGKFLTFNVPQYIMSCCEIIILL